MRGVLRLALLALAAVVRWDRTRIVVTTEKVFLVHGVMRRRASAVMLSSLRIVSLDQSLPGRVLGYGTSWARDGFRCTSRAVGLTCTNTRGHGFFLSRESWRVY